MFVLRFRSTVSPAFLLVFVLAIGIWAQERAKISGTVTDSHGAAVVGATVKFISSENSGSESQTFTDNEGQFTIDPGQNNGGRLVVEARGFEPIETDWRSENPAPKIDIKLSPPAVSANLTITRTESRIENTPASIIALDQRDLESTGAQTLDDKLRQVPGFSLFRRAGSLAANPTTQGVSLRGIGASGASRAIVLLDGVPLNDAFGGWIYWGRVPQQSIADVEMLRGSAGDLYGSGAIGGAISITTRKPTPGFDLSTELSYGTLDSLNSSSFLSGRAHKWASSVGIEAFTSDGFITIDKAARGTVDIPANVQRAVFSPELEYDFAPNKRVFGSISFYREARGNGTPLQTNDTRNWSAAVGTDWNVNDLGIFTGRIYGTTQEYDQTFTAISTDRNSETFLRSQSVPSQVVGFSGLWNGNIRKTLTYFAGAEGHETRGRSDETVFVNARPSSLVTAGGGEFTLGGFAGAVFAPSSRFLITAGVRVDGWQNYRAHSATFSLITGQRTSTVFPTRTESAVSPRVSLLFRFTNNISGTVSYSSGFRQPTLNELYRSFRVGDVLTLANENLRAERASNVEAGVIISGFDGQLFSRGNFFCTEITGPVANITLSVTPTLITRQRQNLGSTRSCGLEIDVESKPLGGRKIVSRLLICRFPGGQFSTEYCTRGTSYPAGCSPPVFVSGAILKSEPVCRSVAITDGQRAVR
jgi:outer membrane receptor protein involved in Fe transport